MTGLFPALPTLLGDGENNILVHCLELFEDIYSYVYMYLCECMPYVLRSSWKLKENVRSSGAGVPDSCELPNLGAGSQIEVLCQSS